MRLITNLLSGRSFAVSPNYLDIYPEMEVSAEHRKAFAETKDGALVGEGLAKKFGWKVGDTIPLSGTIYPGNWSFNIRGIYTVKDARADETLALIRRGDENVRKQSYYQRIDTMQQQLAGYLARDNSIDKSDHV